MSDDGGEDLPTEVDTGVDIEVDGDDDAVETQPHHLILCPDALTDITVYRVPRWCLTDEPRLLVFDAPTGAFYLLHRGLVEYGFWFVDTVALSDGDFLMATRLDPLFLLLHFLAHHGVFETPARFPTLAALRAFRGRLTASGSDRPRAVPGRAGRRRGERRRAPSRRVRREPRPDQGAARGQAGGA